MNYSAATLSPPSSLTDLSPTDLRDEIPRKIDELRDYVIFLENYQVMLQQNYNNPDLFINIKENIGNANALIMKISGLLNQYRHLNLRNSLQKDPYNTMGNDMQAKFDDYKEIYIDTVRKLQKMPQFAKFNRNTEVKHEFINLGNRMSIAETCDDFSVSLYIEEESFRDDISSFKKQILSEQRRKSFPRSFKQSSNRMEELEAELLDEDEMRPTRSETLESGHQIVKRGKNLLRDKLCRNKRKVLSVLLCILMLVILGLLVEFLPVRGAAREAFI